jgi:transcriptional regulator with XRE-family HTH domain
LHQYKDLDGCPSIQGMNRRIGPELGARIKQLREQRQLTQGQVASSLRKSVETISNFERGKTIPSLQTLAALAETLGVGMAAFFQLDAVKEPRHAGVLARLNALRREDSELVSAFIDLLLTHRGKRKR